MINDKLLKIKKWIGLDEAAERLSSIVEGSITVLDLIELGLSKELTLSVRLPYGEKFVGREMIYNEVPIINHLQDMFLFRLCSQEGLSTNASREDVLSAYEEEFQLYLKEDFEKTRERMLNRHGSEYKDLTLESYLEKGKYGDYEYVTGAEYLADVIYDLPMIGAEVLDVQRIYSTNKGYESKGLININGPFLQDQEGRLINLMEEFDKSKKGKSPILEPETNNYFPTDGLPVNSELGLRPENLIAFERTISGGFEECEMDYGLLVGAMLSVLKNTNSKQRRWTQDLLKEELIEIYPQYTRRELDDYFAEANKEFKKKIN